MSRLLDNSEKLRSEIEGRNLYTPENPYTIDNGIIVNTINRLSNIISPFNSVDITNTIAGRITNPNTPLAQIGLQMLGKQFSATIKSLGTAEYTPSINFSNLFDGNPNTKLITKKIDFQITRRETQSNIGKILEELTGSYRPINPFQKGATNEEIFRQTGKGQQTFIFGAINKNYYRNSNSIWVRELDKAGFQYNKRLFEKEYFTGINSNLNPYNTYELFNIVESNTRLQNELNKYRVFSNNNYEYGSEQRFLDSLGKTNSRLNSDGEGNNILNNKNQPTYGNDKSYFDDGLDDNPNNQIVWGRDGASNEYKEIVNSTDNPVNMYLNPNAFSTDSKEFDFNTNRFNTVDASKIGLLNYTKELLNSKGKYGNFDLTKKKFIDRNGNIYFNGSPLSYQVDNQENRTRQHNITDPYNRFVKAIRFDGNFIYEGNENSVINRSVLPKIHPNINKEGYADVRNLMFSIENLAAPVYRDEINRVAYLDDEFGTQLPYHESGENGGRLMWFPPYDIKYSEQALSRHETTSFLGRSEPIYTYNISERIGTLSFKLLIDYPPQVKGMNHISASRFFAFGGVGENRNYFDIGKAEKELIELKIRRDELKPRPQIVEDIVLPNPISFYFRNDEPRVGEETTIIDTTLAAGYEDGKGTDVTIGRDDGLNKDFINKLTDIIDNTFSDPDRRKYYILNVIGEATQLYTESISSDIVAGNEYNRLLGLRRAEAITNKFKEIFISKYNKRPDEIPIFISSSGSTRAPETTGTAESIPTKLSKSFRNATISFLTNNAFDQITNELTPEEQRELDYLDLEIANLETKIKNEKFNLQKGLEYTFNQYELQDGIFKGFRSLEYNRFMPVFHSQTPEDFHRRLTFLHQCTRQGNAIRSKVTDENQTDNYLASKNAVFGRQPVQILRLGDMIHSKIIIDNISFDFNDSTWDLNPEGMGMQFMIADITIQFKIIGGQSLETPINALQNAVSFNYYANSTYYKDGVYSTANELMREQQSINENIINDNNQKIAGRNVNQNI